MKGIGPYASGKILQRIVARPNISGVPSTPGESGATLSKQERAGIRRMRGGTQNPPGAAPHPSGLRPATLSQERVLRFLRRGYDTGRFLRRGLQDQPFQGFFQVFLVYAGIIDDQAVQIPGLGIKGAEGLDLQALGEECLGQGFV